MFFSQNTPAVDGDVLVIGSQKHLVIPTCPVGAPACIPNDGAVVAGADRESGDERAPAALAPLAVGLCLTLIPT